MKIIVKGMNCNHCKTTVEENVMTIPGIVFVNADISSETVDLGGEDYDLDEVRRKIENLGYEFGGKLG